MLIRARTSRRRLLAGLGAGAGVLAAPFFRRDAAAQAGLPGPLRLLVFFSPDGRIPGTWEPRSNGSETAFQLGATMEPFNLVKDELICFQGIDYKGAPGGHDWGTLMFTTGAVGNLHPSGDYVVSSAPSIDQLLTKEIALVGNTQFPSLQMSGHPLRSGSGFNTMSWASAQQPLAAEGRPASNYTHLFQTFAPLGSMTGVKVEELIRRRKSVLDLVETDWRRLAEVLPSAQKPSFDAHLDAIRRLEKALETLAAGPRANCGQVEKSTLPATAYDSGADYPQHLQANLELLRLAFACDSSRIATFMCSPASTELQHWQWNGQLTVHDAHHGIGHLAGGDQGQSDTQSERDAATRDHNLISTWYCEQIARFIKSLRDTDDGGGNKLLDNMIVFYGTDVAHGGTHSPNNVPLMLFGRAGGKLKTGRFLDFSGNRRSSNEIWRSIADLLGVQPFPSIRNNQPLPGLV